MRCYNEKTQKRQPTYIGCTVCNHWLLLSNFVEDFKMIDGYDEKKFLNGELCLDKDIKSNGQNKEYSLVNCMLISKSDNSKQASKTRDNSYMQGENNPFRSKKRSEESRRKQSESTKEENHYNVRRVAQYDLDGNLIKVWNYAKIITVELGIECSGICICCKFWEMDCDKEKWYKTHKSNPRRTAGGFIWKYYKE